MQEKVNNVRLASLNAQSSRNKTLEIKDIIEEKNIDVMCITETWLKDNKDEALMSEMCPVTHDIVSFPRDDRGGGGVAFIFNKSLGNPTFSKINCQSSEVAFFSFSNSSRFNICCFYRLQNENLSIFYKDFKEISTRFKIKNQPFILLGDYNIHFDVENKSKRIKEILEELDLVQKVDVPTHRSKHTIDWLVLPKEDKCVEGFEVYDPVTSDHSLIVVDLCLQKPQKQKKSVTSRKIKDIVISDFEADVKASFNDTNDTIDASELHSKLSKILDCHAPLKTKNIIERPFSDWYNLEIKEAKTEKRRKERVMRKTGLTVHKQIFTFACRTVNKLIEKAKKSFYIEKFQGVRSCKELFSTVDFLFGKKSSSPLPNVSNSENAYNFAHFFIEKIEKIREGLLNTSSPASVLSSFSGTPLFSFDLASQDEVKKVILESPVKHCDLDPIPTSLLRQCIHHLLPSITVIINDSLKSGTVPNCFKSALVKPLLKKPGLDPNILKNFRPVSNLSFLSKILEKIVLKRLLLHLDVNNLNEI